MFTVPVSSAIFWLNDTDLNDTASYESSNNTTYWLSQSDNSHITKNLASIVAGSIVGAIALIVMTVVICIKCMKYRQKQRLTYGEATYTFSVHLLFLCILLHFKNAVTCFTILCTV